MSRKYEEIGFLSDVVPSASIQGKTMVIDRLAPGTVETVCSLSRYVDIVKIGWGLPLLLSPREVTQRVSAYASHGISVSNGGTLLEIAAQRGKHLEAVRTLLSTGFNTIELSEGVVEMHRSAKKEIAEAVHAAGARLNVEVGRKNPRNQLSLDETVERIGEALEFSPDLVIIEGRETGRSVEIYDEAGEIKWDWVQRIQESCPSDKLMFEAPQERQQTEFVLQAGSNVHLGNVSVQSIAALASQRLGLRGDTLGVQLGTPEISAGPSARFIYYILLNHGFMDQGKIMRLTGLNRRTVQNALSLLIREGRVAQRLDPSDMRRHIYSATVP